MKTLRRINIKNCPHYFLNNMINIEIYDPGLLDIGKIFKSTNDVFYHIE